MDAIGCLRFEFFGGLGMHYSACLRLGYLRRGEKETFEAVLVCMTGFEGVSSNVLKMNLKAVMRRKSD